MIVQGPNGEQYEIPDTLQPTPAQIGEQVLAGPGNVSPQIGEEILAQSPMGRQVMPVPQRQPGFLERMGGPTPEVLKGGGIMDNIGQWVTSDMGRNLMGALGVGLMGVRNVRDKGAAQTLMMQDLFNSARARREQQLHAEAMGGVLTNIQDVQNKVAAGDMDGAIASITSLASNPMVLRNPTAMQHVFQLQSQLSERSRQKGVIGAGTKAITQNPNAGPAELIQAAANAPGGGGTLAESVALAGALMKPDKFQVIHSDKLGIVAVDRDANGHVTHYQLQPPPGQITIGSLSDPIMRELQRRQVDLNRYIAVLNNPQDPAYAAALALQGEVAQKVTDDKDVLKLTPIQLQELGAAKIPLGDRTKVSQILPQEWEAVEAHKEYLKAKAQKDHIEMQQTMEQNRPLKPAELKNYVSIKDLKTPGAGTVRTAGEKVDSGEWALMSSPTVLDEVRNLRALKPSLERIQELNNKLLAKSPGVNLAKAGELEVAKVLGKADAQELLTAYKGMGLIIAKAIQGSRPSDLDAQSSQAFLGSPKDTVQSASQKISGLITWMENLEKVKLGQGAQVSPVNPQGKVRGQTRASGSLFDQALESVVGGKK